jgi:hypothetical protein
MRRDVDQLIEGAGMVAGMMFYSILLLCFAAFSGSEKVLIGCVAVMFCVGGISMYFAVENLRKVVHAIKTCVEIKNGLFELWDEYQAMLKGEEEKPHE